MPDPTPQSSNPLGSASLGLGIASLVLVFGIGLFVLAGAQQGWIKLFGTPFFVCGASSAFLGFLGAALGLAGLVGKNRPRTAALAGLILGLAGLCLFVGIARAVTGG